MTLDTRVSSSSATPPQNLEAEAAVLGALLVSAEAMERVSDILKPESFYQPRHGHVFRAALELSKRAQPVDIITIRDELLKLGLLDAAGGLDYLMSLESGAGIAANVEAHARVIEEAAVRRGMLATATRIHDLATNVGIDVQRALGLAEEQIFQLSNDRTTDEAVPLTSLLHEQWDQIERRHEDPNSATGVPSGFYMLDEMTGGFQKSQLIILAARPSVGKALALDTPIPTPTGWKTMGSLRVGDQVFDDRGRPCTVTMATPVMYGRRCYEVEFSDGETIVADEEHQWAVRTRAARKRRGEAEVLTTGQMAKNIRVAGGRANYAIETCGPLQYVEQELPVPPYALGAWLGDGNTNGAVITVGDPEVVEELIASGVAVSERVVSGGRTRQVGLSAGRGYRVGVKLTGAQVREIRAQRSSGLRLGAIAAEFGISVANTSLIVNGKTWADPERADPVQVRLRALGVLGNKHIPRAYLEASTAQRLDLLQGLMDTDGTIDDRGQAEFTSIRRRLGEDVLELVRGLGMKPTFRVGRATLNGVDHGPNYRVYFKPTVLPVFRIPRKLNRQLTAPFSASCRHRTIEQIRAVASVPVRCIQVDSMSHLYLAGRACIATHNTSLALNVAQHVAVKEKQAVAVFSLEMSRYDLTQRLLCAEAGVDSKLVRTGKLSEGDWSKIANAMGTLSEGELYIDDRPSLSILELRARARRLKARHDIKLVVLDYLQLMYGSGRPENRNQEVSEISRGLKALARELDCPVIALSQLSRAPEQRGDRKPQLSDLRESGCLTGDTQVYLPDAGIYRPMKDLVGLAGFNVTALNTETWKLEPARVSNAFSTGFKPVSRMTTRTGRSIRATGNHKFLTVRGWKRLDQLEPADHVALPRWLVGPEEATLSDPELALVGHLIGDGCTLPRHVIQYTTRERDLAEMVASLATEVFGDTVKPRITSERTWFQVYLSSAARLTHGVRNPIAAWLDQMGIFGLRSNEKRVPHCVFRQPIGGVSVFLRHLWATDGCINSATGIYYATSSDQLAKDVQSLLLRIGVNAVNNRVSQGARGRDQFHVRVMGQVDRQRFLSLVGGANGRRQTRAAEILLADASRTANTNRDIIPASVWVDEVLPAMTTAGLTHRAFQAAIDTNYCGHGLYRQNLGRGRAGRVASVVGSDALLRLSESDVYWDQISSIVPDGTEEVFDLTVDSLHNFVAQDIVVHNSIEQDADLVMFIYREGLHNEEVKRNKTELIVAKHRNGPIGDVPLLFMESQTRFVNVTRQAMGND